MTDPYNNNQSQWTFNDEDSYEEVEVDEDELSLEVEVEVDEDEDELSVKGEIPSLDFRQNLVDEQNASLWECNFTYWPPRNSDHPFDESFDESEVTPGQPNEEQKAEISHPNARIDLPLYNQNRYSARDPPPQPSTMPEEQPSSIRRIPKPQIMPEDIFVAQHKAATVETVASSEVETKKDFVLTHDGIELNNEEVLERGLVGFDIHQPEDANQKPAVLAKRKRQNWGIWEFLLLFLYLVLVAGLASCIYFFVLPQKENESKQNPTVANGGLYETTTPLDPYDPGNCDLSSQVQPHVLSQCSCYGKITTLSDDTMIRYDDLVKNFVVPRVYSEWTHAIISCHPVNQALVWLSTVSTLDESDILQRFVLAYIYFAMHGTDWNSKRSWITQSDVCSWHGLDCNPEGVIRKIDLSNNHVKGELISELGLLQQLEVLELNQNALSGSIASEIVSLSALAIADFSGNSLVGSIPSQIGVSAPTLQLLGLNGNRLSGSVPSEIGQATQLQVLDLSGNRFAKELPTEIDQLTSLFFLSVANNALLSGRLPAEWSQLTNLMYLSISHTDIRSRIPQEFGSLTNMKDIRMDNTLVSGSIPSEFANMTSLAHLDLGGSRITGSVPSELGLLDSLEFLALHDTLLSGRSPNEVCALREKELEVYTTQCPSRGDHGELVGVICPTPFCCSECIEKKSL